MPDYARPAFRVSLGLLFALGALACVSAPASPPERETTHPFLIDEGARDFAAHCASCHGSDGRGGGPAAGALVTAPADLTRIAARRDGKFPSLDVAYLIDGRFELQAHGSREMPVWGRRFLVGLPEDELGDAIVRGRIEALIEYLKSIQQSP
ncbi:MAG: cytochrome c [bacterium]|nr:cytochrome c [bacterium]MCP5065209.1 cytochrome c [bacterium]